MTNSASSSLTASGSSADPFKFAIPAISPDSVQRTEILDRLSVGGWRFGLVAATAASGKTTAVSQWLQRRFDGSKLWVNLDGRDSAPERYWDTVLAGLETAVPGSFKERDSNVEGNPWNGEAVVEYLLGEFAQLTEPLVVVLDDFHFVRQREIHEDLAFLIERLPTSVQVIAVTRTDPQLPLSRWRVRGWQSDIRGADLAFTLNEAQQLCRINAGGCMTPSEVEQVWKTSEGWVAGLRAGARAASQRDRDLVVETPLRTDPMIIDLLVSEVLDQQPPEIVNFLLRTCVIDTLDAELCDALSGRIDSQRVLEDLAIHLQLVSASRSHIAQFRHHRLFLEALRLELPLRLPGELRSLARTAAGILQARGDTAAAVACLLRCGNVDEAFEMTYAGCYDQHDKGRPGSAAECLDLLPVEAAMESTQRMLVYTLCLGLIGRGEAAVVWLKRVCAKIDRDGNPLLEDLITVDIFKLMAFTVLGLWPEGIEPGNRALAHAEGSADLGMPGTRLRPNLARAYLLMDRVQDARHVLERTAGCGEVVDLVLVPANQARCAARQGELREALRLSEEVLVAAETIGVQSHLGVIDALLARFEAFFEHNSLSDARDAMVRLEELVSRHPEGLVYRVLALLGLIRLAGGEGRFDDAFELANEAREILGGVEHPALSELINLAEARWRVESGGLPIARTLIERVGPSRVQRSLLDVRIHLAEGRRDEASQLLSSLIPGSPRDSLEIGLLQMRSSIESGRSGDEQVASVLVAAMHECMARSVLDEGPEVTRLVRAAAMKLQTPAADQLSTALGAPQRSRVATIHQSILSERELSILRFLPTNLTNQEIAAECLMSVNTVKTHLKSIYGKFGVNSRAEAVRSARARGLL